jgi:hypothetical protein
MKFAVSLAHLSLLAVASLVFATVSPAAPEPPVNTGWDSGNAGDTFGYEFILSGRDLVQKLNLLYKDSKPVFDTTNLKVAVATTEVVSEEHVYLRGFERDAVNFFPTKRMIDVNRSRWRELRRSTETKARLLLVLHEFLWVSGQDDTNFTISTPLIELLNVSNYSPNVWWNPVNPANYVAATLSYAPAGCGLDAGHFDVNSAEETVVLESKGDCKDAYRKLQIVKTSGVTPVSSNVHGLFHKFDLTVFDRSGQVVGKVGYEPEWGVCLLPENKACQVSGGKWSVGGVDVVFWFLKD